MKLKNCILVLLVCLLANSTVVSAEVEFLWSDNIDWGGYPSIESDSENNLLVTWTSGEMNIRKYDEYGSEIFTLNEQGNYYHMDLDVGQDNGFIVAYNKHYRDNDLNRDIYEIYAQRYFSNGTANGGSIFVSSQNVGYGGKVAINPINNDFLVIYQGCGGLCGKLFDVNGELLQELQIYSGWINIRSVNIASRYDGEYIVVLEAYSGQRMIVGKEYYINGSQKSEFIVSNNGSKNPSLDVFSDGGFVVAWEDYRINNQYPLVFAKVYNPDATVKIEDIQLDNDINEDDYVAYISVATDPINNDFAITWVKAQGPQWDIHVVAQRYGYDGMLKDEITEVGDTSENSQANDIEITPNHDIAISFEDGQPYIITKWRTMEGQRAIIEELQSEKDGCENNIIRVEEDLRTEFNNPAFVIQGNTLSERISTLVDALIGIPRGDKNDLYKILN